MIGILFATHSEAKPFFDLVQARSVAEKPFATYEFYLFDRTQRFVVAISGIGKVPAALAAQHLITAYQVTRIINPGVCGAVADSILPGQAFCVTESQEGDVMTRNGARPSYNSSRMGFEDLPSARLITQDKPVRDAEKRKQAAQWGELVDMEGAAVAKTCMLAGVEAHLVKVVSDLANESTEVDIKQNLPDACDRLAKVLLEGLTKLKSSTTVRKKPELHATGTLKKLLRFVRVEHTLFSLPLLFAGAWIGAGYRLASLTTLLLILLAGTGARTLGMAMNRILDRKLDAKNPRTADRELPSGRLSLPKAFSMALAGLSVYLVSCILIGKTCTVLSPIPALLLVFYSLLKRFTNLCHFGIGLVLALAPVGAYVAVGDGEVFNLDLNLDILLLAGFTFCWMSGFDIIYALQDVASDLQTGIKSLPARLGSGPAQRIAALVHLTGLSALAVFVLVTSGGKASWLALFAASLTVGLAYVPWIPLPARFFPISAIAGIAGALVPFLKDLT